MPWGNIERYTFAQLDLNANEKVVAFAEPFHVPVNLKDSSSWQPKTATAQYKQQNPVTAQLLAGGYVFKIPPQRAAGALTLRAGDDTGKNSYQTPTSSRTSKSRCLSTTASIPRVRRAIDSRRPIGQKLQSSQAVAFA